MAKSRNMIAQPPTIRVASGLRTSLPTTWIRSILAICFRKSCADALDFGFPPAAAPAEVAVPGVAEKALRLGLQGLSQQFGGVGEERFQQQAVHRLGLDFVSGVREDLEMNAEPGGGHDILGNHERKAELAVLDQLES